MNIREDIALILLLILFAGNNNPEGFRNGEALEGINSFILIILIFFLFNNVNNEERDERCGRRERCR